MAWLKLFIVAVLLVNATAVVVQNGVTFPNADFFVTFYSYNVTGFMTVVSFVPGAVCTIDVNSLAGKGNISVMLWRDAIDAECDFGAECFNILINNIGTNSVLRDALVLAVDSQSTEYSDNWQASPEMLASGILFTSMRNDSWSQLSLDLPVTVTPGWSIWQAYYLSSANLGLYVTFALIWSALCVSFLANLIDYFVKFILQKLAFTLAMELNVFGFVFSTIFFGMSVTRAAFVFNNQLFLSTNLFAILSFSLIDLYIGFAVLSAKWLSLCHDTQKLSPKFVKISNIIQVVLTVITCIDLVLFGAYFSGASLPSNGRYVLYVLGAVLMIATFAYAVLVSVCFGNIWSALNIFNQSNRHRRVGKLAFLTIGLVFSLLVFVLLVVVQILAVETAQVFIAIDCMILLCEIPVLISWLALSDLWIRMFKLTSTHSSSGPVHHDSIQQKGKESAEDLSKKRQSLNELLDEGLAKHKQTETYEIGELRVEM